MTRIAVIFDNFGPYHLARLAALDRSCELTAIELHQTSADYDWLSREEVAFSCKSLSTKDNPQQDTTAALWAALDEARPDAIVVPGWSSKAALAALLWAQSAAVPAILMSDSRAEDAPRRRLSEWIKRQIVAGYAGALVAGTAHRAYVRALGLPDDRIETGYDTVDNAHFAKGAEAARANAPQLRAELELPQAYFLVSARLIAKKNLFFLLNAYKLYRAQAATPPIHLVIIGDGPLRVALEAHLRQLGLEPHVSLPGFIQYDMLPAYYGLATALVMPSLTDQWGLVVNEAMASGLPVLVSTGAGAAEDLVDPGRNGYRFDPTDAEGLARLMIALSDRSKPQLAAMGTASQEIISAYAPEVFATKLTSLVDQLRAEPVPRLSAFRRAFLKILSAFRGRC